MIGDIYTKLSDLQVVTTTAVSTNSIDMLAKKDIIQGSDLEAHIIWTVANAAGATSVDFQVGQADDTSGTNFEPLATSGAIPIASLLAPNLAASPPVLGTEIVLKFSPRNPNPPAGVGGAGAQAGALPIGRPHLIAKYIVVGTLSGGGAITTKIVPLAARTPNPATNYPSGYTV